LCRPDVTSLERELRQHRLDIRCRRNAIEYAVDSLAEAGRNMSRDGVLSGHRSVERRRCELDEGQEYDERANRGDEDRSEEFDVL
jgi:hypothetical protein